MKGGQYRKTLAKIWFEGIIRTRDIRGNLLPKFIEFLYGDAMLELIRMSSNMADGNQQKHYRVLLQKCEFSPRGTHKP